MIFCDRLSSSGVFRARPQCYRKGKLWLGKITAYSATQTSMRLLDLLSGGCQTALHIGFVALAV